MAKVTKQFVFTPKEKIKRLMNEYKNAMRKPHPNIDITIQDKNINIWYCLLHSLDGNNNEFKGGEYILKFTIPPSYPNFPPSLEVITPNGVFLPSEDICISVGKYHSNNFASGRGLHGFMTEACITGFILNKELGHGIGIVDDIKKENIITFANESINWNKKHIPKLYTKFSSYTKYKKRRLINIAVTLFFLNIENTNILRKIIGVPLPI